MAAWFSVVLSAGILAPADVIDIVNQVSATSLGNYLGNTLYAQNGDNRGLSGADHDPARNNIFSEFSNLSLATSLEAFTYNSATYYNVIGVQLGVSRPNDVYIVGAHYDSAGNPGADDDGSGTAGVLEAARILSQYSFEATVVFAAFDREEQGLIGSEAYASAHTTDHILGMIELDMIAYNPGNHNAAAIYGRASSTPIKQNLAAAISLYGDGLSSTIGGDLPYSDHAPFESYGFQACLLIESDHGSNPYYHRPGDSVDTAGYIDYDYAARMTRSAVGYLADNAVLIIPEPGTIALFTIAILCFAPASRFWGRALRFTSAKPHPRRLRR
jgi:Zn-dependent M28 family amino/carboxypeptidase